MLFRSEPGASSVGDFFNPGFLSESATLGNGPAIQRFSAVLDNWKFSNLGYAAAMFAHSSSGPGSGAEGSAAAISARFLIRMALFAGSDAKWRDGYRSFAAR